MFNKSELISTALLNISGTAGRVNHKQVVYGQLIDKLEGVLHFTSFPKILSDKVVPTTSVSGHGDVLVIDCITATKNVDGVTYLAVLPHAQIFTLDQRLDYFESSDPQLNKILASCIFCDDVSSSNEINEVIDTVLIKALQSIVDFKPLERSPVKPFSFSNYQACIVNLRVSDAPSWTRDPSETPILFMTPTIADDIKMISEELLTPFAHSIGTMRMIARDVTKRFSKMREIRPSFIPTGDYRGIFVNRNRVETFYTDSFVYNISQNVFNCFARALEMQYLDSVWERELVEILDEFISRVRSAQAEVDEGWLSDLDF